MLERMTKRCDKIALVMFYVLMADVCIFGAGKLISLGSLTFRMLLLGLTGLVALPVIFKNIPYLMKNKYTWVIGGFCIWLIISTILGIKNRNATALMITDLKGFLYFALFPIAMCLIRTRQRVERLSKVLMYSAAVMAIIHVLCIVWHLVHPDSLFAFNAFAYEKHFFYISFFISPTNIRINFLSLVCLLFGCALSVYYRVKEQIAWKKYLYTLITGICLFAIWLSYTRSIYLAAGISALCTVIVFLIRTDWTQKRRLIAHLCGGLAVFFVIIGAFWIGTGTNYFQYGLDRALVGTRLGQQLQSGGSWFGEATGQLETTEPSGTTEPIATTEPGVTVPTEQAQLDGLMTTTVTSDDLRTLTINDLMTNIGRSPIWGLGLGATIPSRPDGLNEYFFLDLWSKTGLIGLCLYLAPLVFMAFDLLKHLWGKSEMFHLMGVWVAVILGFVAYSYFTPCMNSSVGIMCYCCAMAVSQQTSAELSAKTKRKDSM